MLYINVICKCQKWTFSKINGFFINLFCLPWSAPLPSTGLPDLPQLDGDMPGMLLWPSFFCALLGNLFLLVYLFGIIHGRSCMYVWKIECIKQELVCNIFSMAPTLVRPWSYDHPVGRSLTHHFIEQMRTDIHQPGQRPGTTVGDERHVLQASWSRKDI